MVRADEEDEFFDAEGDGENAVEEIDQNDTTEILEDHGHDSLAFDAMLQIRELMQENIILEESGAIKEFLQHLGPSFASHPYVQEKPNQVRFLRADAHNAKLAAERMIAHIEWRESVKPETVICRACEKNPQSHYMHNVGFDKFKRPVIYSCFQLAKDRASVESNVEHITMNLEASIMHMGPGVETYVWVCDFYGFGVQDCSLALGKAAIQLFSKHYPQRLGAFLFVGAPFIFSAVWSQLKLFMDQRQIRKVRFLEGPFVGEGKPLRQNLSQIFQPEMVNWLLTEMAQNRDPGAAAGKAWLKGVEVFQAGSSLEHNLLGPSDRLACIGKDLERRERALQAEPRA